MGREGGSNAAGALVGGAGGDAPCNGVFVVNGVVTVTPYPGAHAA